MNTEVRPKVDLQTIALRAKDRDYQALAINLLKPNLIQPEEMCRLQIPPELDWQQGVILYGAAPSWLYAHLVWRFQHASWVGCYDIRSQAVIVVSSKVPALQPGDTIEIVPNKDLGAAILIGGPPNSGKSVLSNALRLDVLAQRPDVQIYLHRANWDGEGNHTYETPDRNLATSLKKKNKFKLHWHQRADELITKYFVDHSKAVTNIRQVVDLALVDVGGVPDLVKTPVVEKCSHYIIISNEKDKVEAWHKLCAQKLQPLAVIHSVLEEKLEVIRTQPFLEIVAGPWQSEQSQAIPDLLLKQVLKLLL